ncbi:ATP synthase subunit a [Bacteroidota bacterium]|nr:ATP synthase subunit a [Bacteroidota bacterium]
MLKFKLFITIFLLSIFSVPAVSIAQENNSANQSENLVPNEPKKEDGKFNAKKVILEHISDSHEWHFFSYPSDDGYKSVALPLPCILYSKAVGFSFFMFNHLEEGAIDGYKLNAEHHIERADGAGFYDLSITKNVAAMLISSILLIWLFRTAAKGYGARPNQAPTGMQNLMEVLVSFVRDEAAKPFLGKKTDKYLPYLLTVFFFIWINNMLGLLPGGANVTGNIAVTTTLALFTFILILTGSRKHYWMHILNPPGIPFGVKLILVPVEILGIVTKPFALLIRLFANMTAGHLIVLSFLSMIFIFGQMSPIAGGGISIFSIAFSTFIYLLEMLVCALQAYIFTMLSSVFISEAIAGGHDHEEHAAEEHH